MSPLPALLKFVSDAIVIVSAEGVVAHATKRACRLSGKAESELVNQRIDTLVDGRGVAELGLLQAHGRPDQEARFESTFEGTETKRPLLFEAIKLEDGGLCVRLRDVAQSPLEARYDRALLGAATVEYATDKMIWLDNDGYIVFANASARAHFSKIDDSFMRKPIYELVSYSNKDLWPGHVRELQAKKHMHFETINQIGPNEFVPLEVSITSIEFDGTRYGCVVFNDISERKRLERELVDAHAHLHRLARTDSLSGLANRRFFDEQLSEELAGHKLSGAPLSLIVVDVDFFKLFNDTYGHLAGDECLSRIGEALRRSVVREGDFVARFGGEEFACILPSTSLDDAMEAAERMRRNIMELGIVHRASDAAQIVTASFGVVSMVCSHEAVNATLIEAADRCLYVAKSRGRNGVIGRDITTTPQTAAVA